MRCDRQRTEGKYILKTFLALSFGAVQEWEQVQDLACQYVEHTAIPLLVVPRPAP